MNLSNPMPGPAGDGGGFHDYVAPGPLGFSNQVIEDAVTLQDDGMLPPALEALVDEVESAPGTVGWALLCDYLSTRDLHGYAARYLAAHGIEHRCPDWCIGTHDRYQLKLPGNCVMHDAWTWTDPESAATVSVSATTSELDGRLLTPEIDVFNSEALTGAQAVRLAEAITVASEVYQGLLTT